MGAIRREMNSGRWTAFAISYQCILAYAVSLMIYQFGTAVTGCVNIAGVTAAFIVLLLMLFFIIRPDKKRKGMN